MVARSDDQTDIFDDPFVATNNQETRLMVTYTLPDNLPPAPPTSDELMPNRYEQVSQLVKAFQNNLKKHTQENFKALHMDMEHFTIVLDNMTSNSCVLILIGDTRIRKSLLYECKYMAILTHNSFRGTRRSAQYQLSEGTIRKTSSRIIKRKSFGLQVRSARLSLILMSSLHIIPYIGNRKHKHSATAA